MELGPVYTAHARQEMAADGLTEADVEAVLRGFDMERIDRHGNRRLSGAAAGRRMTIIVAKDSVPPRIITVWATSRGRLR